MKRRKPYVRYSEAFKRTVVEEVETGIMTANQATKYYGLGGRDTIYRWIKTYGMNEEKGRKVIIMTRKEETKLTTAHRRIAELEKELSEAKLRALAWESMVEVAEEMGIPLKKSPGKKRYQMQRKSSIQRDKIQHQGNLQNLWLQQTSLLQAA